MRSLLREAFYASALLNQQTARSACNLWLTSSDLVNTIRLDPDLHHLLRFIDFFLQSIDPIIFGTALAGGSIQEIDHFLQISKSGDFVAYDYGLEGNQQVYKHVEPTGYNLSKITIPIILHYGRTDAIATPKAVHRLYKALSGTLGVYEVDAAPFGHYDFIWSPSLQTLVNANVIKSCDEFLKGVLKYRIE